MIIVDQIRTTHLCIKMIKVSSAHGKMGEVAVVQGGRVLLVIRLRAQR
jgi:hypothetical protein